MLVLQIQIPSKARSYRSIPLKWRVFTLGTSMNSERQTLSQFSGRKDLLPLVHLGFEEAESNMMHQSTAFLTYVNVD